ncbi:MAG TPA: RNA polymerase sigma factor [Opitutaceae bacterium]|nr:RNA polymerase sigma factor [Opitutaceae bacterium]
MPKPPPPHGPLAALYAATIRPLRGFLARLVTDRDEAQDIAHDAYLRILPQLDAATARNPEALLYVTARRLALNRLKRRQRSPIDPAAVPESEPADPQSDTARAAVLHQELDLLEHAIAELPAGCRSVLRLRHHEQLSHRAIAERLGIAVSTVEKQHARALRLLRASLDSATDNERALP